MDTQWKTVIETLQGQRWKLSGLVEGEEWWALKQAHFTRLKQVLVVTLLADPQDDGPHPRAWAIGFDAHPPRTRLDAGQEGLLTLGRGWRERFSDLLADNKSWNLSLELQAFDDHGYQQEIAALGDGGMTDVLDELTRD